MSSKHSRRTRRLERRQKLLKGGGLNLVSLMDIFTILVFFLLVNSSSAPQLPSQKDLRLPSSTAKKAPRETLLLMITPESLILQGREIISVAELMQSKGDVIEPLKSALEFQSKNRFLKEQVKEGEKEGESLTIMGDENLPFELLQKILATCQQANYTEIAFAAQQTAKPKS